MQPGNQSITGVILAGGRSRRMGGNDKGLLQIGGRAMIEYVIETLSLQVDRILINANRNLAHYRRFGYSIITDRISGYAGPLAGMAAAIQACESEYILSTPCDGPWTPADLATRLFDRMIAEEARLCTAHDGKRLQPVFTLMHRDLLPSILDYLASGERRLGHWIHQQNPALADFSDQPALFFNVNSPAELEAAEARLQTPSQPVTGEDPAPDKSQ